MAGTATPPNLISPTCRVKPPLSGVNAAVSSAAYTTTMEDTIDEKVREAVARCIPQNTVLRIRPVSTQIAAARPEDGVSPAMVAQELLAAGVAAGVPIEMEMPAVASASRGQRDDS